MRQMGQPEREPEANAGTGVQVIAVTSGKGGVGKTNVVANLAIALQQTGKRVTILDADLGLGNLDVLLGIATQFTLENVLNGDCGIQDVLVKGPQGILILPASSGVETLTNLMPDQQLTLQAELEQLQTMTDILLIDTGAGISNNVLYFTVAAQEILIVANPEPTSITDAYALMKILANQYSEHHFHLLVNRATTAKEAEDVHHKLSTVADRYLPSIAIDYLGFIPQDAGVAKAVCQQRAIMDLNPQAPSSQAFRALAQRILRWTHVKPIKGSIQFLIQDKIKVHG